MKYAKPPLATTTTDAVTQPKRFARRWGLVLLLAIATSPLLSGCILESACQGDQTFDNGLCIPPAEEGTGGTGGTDGSAGGAGGAPDTSGPMNFGDACVDGGDECTGGLACGGPLGYCTQVSCAEGEANDGVCPADWSCTSTGREDPPSVCLR